MFRWLYQNTLQRKEVQARQIHRESGSSNAEDTQVEMSLDTLVDMIMTIVLTRANNLDDGESVVGFRLRELDPYVLRQHDHKDVFKLIDSRARRLGFERVEVSSSAHSIHYFTDLHRLSTLTP